MLFAAYAVLFVWSQNLGETDPLSVAVPLVIVVLGAMLATIILGALLRDRRRGAIVATPLVVGLLMYGHAAHYLTPLNVPGFVQQAAWLVLVVVGVVAAVRLDTRHIATLDTALTRIAALLIGVALVAIVAFQLTAASSRGPLARAEPQPDTTTAPKRDVYWLVFDRYGSDRSLELQYGIQNDLTPWLEDQGFTVLDQSHANYSRTVLSMSSTLTMEHLGPVVAAAGERSSDLSIVNARLQDPLVARQFKELGYRYFHIGSWWDPTSYDVGADVNVNVPSPLGAGDFTDAIYDASAVPAMLRRVGLERSARRDRQYAAATTAFEGLADLRDEPGPKFVLAHVLLPHPPLVFDRDGSYLSEAETDALTPVEQYERQLAYTNDQIRAILGDLLALPEEQRPIVILQADEGPWPTSYVRTYRDDADWAAGVSDDELEQKFGILNAWYLPDGEESLGLTSSQSAINTFPILFSRYFGLDYPLLPDTVYASHDWLHPYQLTDITGRLPTLR